MARMHSRKKGKSGSVKPLEQDLKDVLYSDKEIEKLVVKLGKTGIPSAKIGLQLRDSYGIPDVQKLTNKSISKILKENELYPELPEDLISLLKKEITLIAHMESNKKDMPSKRGLQLTESKIRRLVKYYKAKNVLPKSWKYTKEQAKILVG